MTTLQKKAHHSLEEYRSGNIIPLAKQPANQSELGLQHGEDDELVKLGGTTRLVERPSPPPLPALLDRSPTSLQPVVPFPPVSGNSHVHQSVAEYLGSFHHPNASNGRSHSGSMSNGQGYGASSPLQEHFPQYHGRSSSSYGGEYDECQTPQSIELLPGQYPAYFPVYDYPHPTGSNVNGYEYRDGNVLQRPAQGMPGTGNRGDSPEGNMMQEVWQEFVASVR